VSGGSSPREVVDRIRDLGWRGVFGNTDEAIARPDTLEEFAAQSPAPEYFGDAVRDDGVYPRSSRRRANRMARRSTSHRPLAVLHASPPSAWPSPFYGHIHQPFVRYMAGLTVINAGSVSQSFDGAPRASYLLIDKGTPTVRRVE
jgi:hypothetical protein